MPNPSYYFTLFKKFQCLGHVPEGSAHGGNTPPAGVSFKDPVALYSATRQGVGLIGSNTSDSPLWGVLNAKANTQPSFTYAGLNWLPMPIGTPVAWTDQDVGGLPLVGAFTAWLAAGKPQDFPGFITIPNGGTVPGGLDPGGASVFVCSVGNDDGTRPGTVPNDFWNGSLIYLTDRSNGTEANPPTLHGALELYVAAVIGNRGNAAGGNYAAGPTSATTPGVQATAWALTFGTGGASPAVQLPSLSNLDITSQSGVNDVYFLPSARYDIVGFRFTVQTVFDGLVQAINDAVANGVFTLPTNVSAETWLKTPPSHVCLKVAVRRDDQSWPLYDSSPLVERRIAQKNLVIFDTDLAAPSSMPNIKWKYFTMGGPLAAMKRIVRGDIPDLGLNTLILKTDFARQAARVLLAVPRATFVRWIGKERVKGFEIIERECHEQFRVPFDDHVVLAQRGDEDAVRVPFLDDNVLPMAIGVEIDEGQLKPDTVQRVTLVQRAVMPRFGSGKQQRCYELEEVVVGGFTLEFRIRRSEAPKR